MPCIDRTLGDSQFFSIAKKIVNEEKAIANEQQRFKPFKCQRATKRIEKTPLFSIESKNKLPAIG